MLITALLAKATSNEVNPLSLQAGAAIVGAYDARSLCHKVIVPNQKRLLRNALGGSNEPFLNKPARFPSIDPSNAVRRGSDAKLLASLHSLLVRINSSTFAREALVYYIYALWRHREHVSRELDAAAKGAVGGRHRVERYLKALMARSERGETSALVCGIVIHLLCNLFRKTWDIVPHPANVSGSSSLQSGDIDVYCRGTLFMSVEVKDKSYRLSDIEHAAMKAKQAGAATLLFVLGPHALIEVDAASPEVRTGKVDSDVFVVKLDALISSVIPFVSPSIDLSAVCALTLRIVDKMRVRDETLRHVTAVMRKFGSE
jgi:hypothetical protein